ncbi:hypothetical protein [Ralstonia wenshanensis]|uniref:hypothetical protein n=1 Tax=Ralstonia wenshanensis TaxID=2842456 RepID=UPI003D953D77
MRFTIPYRDGELMEVIAEEVDIPGLPGCCVHQTFEHGLPRFAVSHVETGHRVGPHEWTIDEAVTRARTYIASKSQKDILTALKKARSTAIAIGRTAIAAAAIGESGHE